MVMAYLIEAVYLLELERQERRDAAAVAQQWWKPFQYRLAHELVSARSQRDLIDRSISRYLLRV